MSWIGRVVGSIGGYLLGGPTGAVTGYSLGKGVDASLDQSATNAQNLASTREQMAFQERMSSTAYQRGVEDMKKAGLNPMLAYQQGGASTPGGSSVKLESPEAVGASSAQAAASTLVSGTQAAQQAAQAEMLQAQAAKIRSETLEQKLHSARLVEEIDAIRSGRRLKDSQNETEKMRPDLVGQQTELARRQAGIAQIEETLRGDTFSADVARRKTESKLVGLQVPQAEAEAAFWANLGQVNPYLALVLQTLRGANSAKALIEDLPRGYRGLKVTK